MRKPDHEILRAADNVDLSWRLARLQTDNEIRLIMYGAMLALHWVMDTRTVLADKFDTHMDAMEQTWTPEKRDAIRVLVED